MVSGLSGILRGMDSGSENGGGSIFCIVCIARNNRGGFETCWDEDSGELDPLSDRFNFSTFRGAPGFFTAVAYVY